jgi:putative tricarboxylic transport membrane protein
MKVYDFACGLFLTALSIAVCGLAYRLGLNQVSNPGAGLIPFGVAALLGLMSLGLVLRNVGALAQGSRHQSVFKGVDWRRVVLALCGITAYAIAFNWLGFRICTFLLMVWLLKGVGRQRWRTTIAVSLITVICAYLLFVVWLACPFPRGPFQI